MSKNQYPSLLTQYIEYDIPDSLGKFKKHLEMLNNDKDAKNYSNNALKVEILPAVMKLLNHPRATNNDPFLDALFAKDVPLARDDKFFVNVVKVLKCLSLDVAKNFMQNSEVQEVLKKELNASTREHGTVGSYNDFIILMKERDDIAQSILYSQGTQQAFLTNENAHAILLAHPKVMKMAAEVIKVDAVLRNEVQKINPNFLDNLQVIEKDENIKLRQRFEKQLTSNSTLKRKDLIASGMDIDAGDAKSNTLAEVAQGDLIKFFEQLLNQEFFHPSRITYGVQQLTYV